MVSLDILAQMIMVVCMYKAPGIPAYDKLNCGEYVTNCTIGPGYDKMNEAEVMDRVVRCSEKALDKGAK
jgi:hypothetical protein